MYTYIYNDAAFYALISKISGFFPTSFHTRRNVCFPLRRSEDM